MSGDIAISPTDPSEIDVLARFLRTAFHAAPDARWCSADTLAWKYFGGSGPALSFLARRDAAIVGHVGLVRRRLDVPANGLRQSLAAVHFIDWVALPGTFPTGRLLMAHGLSGAQVAYSFGGSAAGRAAAQAAGYVSRSGIPVFARVLNPWHRFALPDHPRWRALAGGARDLARRSATRPRRSHVAISLERTSSFGPEITPILDETTERVMCTERSVPLMNRQLRCPVGEVSGFHVRCDGRLIGAVLLTIITSRGVRYGRVVECLVGASAHHWRAALDAVVAEFGRQRADIVTCYAGTPVMADACAAAGLRLERLLPLAIRDADGAVPLAPMHVTHLEADHALF